MSFWYLLRLLLVFVFFVAVVGRRAFAQWLVSTVDNSRIGARSLVRRGLTCSEPGGKGWEMRRLRVVVSMQVSFLLQKEYYRIIIYPETDRENESENEKKRKESRVQRVILSENIPWLCMCFFPAGPRTGFVLHKMIDMICVVRYGTIQY